MSHTLYVVRKVDQVATMKLLALVVSLEEDIEFYCLSYEVQKALEANWTFLVANQRRGFCDYAFKVITIPLWAMDKGRDYILYYLSHELAHFKAGKEAMYGPLFMQAFISICPPLIQHYETGYKPRNAMQAGITPSDF